MGRRSPRKGFRASALAVVCLAVTSCGSTVPTGARSTADGQQGGGLQGLDSANSTSADAGGLAAGGGGSVPAGTGAALAGAGADNGAGGSGAAASGSGAAASGSALGGTAGRATTAGLVPATFKIGLQYTSNGGAAIGAVTGKGVSTSGDGRDAYNPVIAWINKHGGIAGRPAVPAYNDINAYDGPSQQSQVACSQWTEDNHVALAIPTNDVGDMNLMRDCLGRAHTPAFMGYVHARTLRASFKSSPLWYENGTLSLEDYARTYIGGLAKQGFFRDGDKVGVVYYDKTPFPAALKSDLLPALAEAGVKDPVTFGASIDGAETLASGSQEMDSAVLSFRTKGVTKVLFFEPWIGYFEFLNHAKSQHYQPTYGFTSQQGTQIAADLGFVPADQLTGARLVSWNPMVDVKGYQPYLGPRAKLCLQIFKDAGVAETDQTTQWGTLLACEQLLLVQDAYRNAPKRLSPQDFTRGMNALGSRVEFATRPGGSFGSGKQWATSTYWAGHFDSAKASFVLEGAPQPVM